MKKERMFVRPLTAEERQALHRGLKSADAFTLRRLDVGWLRTKHWITSPDPEYARKKRCGTC